MRIPTSKIYRAFPELDHLSDEQCERLLVRTRNDELPQTFRLLVCVAVGSVTLLMSFSLFMTFVRDDGSLSDLVLLVAIPAVPAILTLFTRDVLLRRALRKAITSRIDRVRCPRCRYILIGQRPVDEHVTCPECGNETSLETLGVTVDDLVLPSKPELR
ncbi:MAG: hypothetical protein GY715_13480 [Planctomycetes bacterium]|nr:hypothetical protein [Planctomycetota bacterium]